MSGNGHAVVSCDVCRRNFRRERAIEALGKGDVLVLAEWDRAARSMLDGIRIIERVAGRGATFKALDRE